MALSNNLTRIIVAVIAIPLILLTSYFGHYYFYLFVLFIGLLSYYEFWIFVKNKKSFANLPLGLLIIALLITNQFKHLVDIYTILVISVLLILIIELFRDKGSAIGNVGSTVLGIFYIGFCSSSLVAIREFFPDINDLYLRGGFVIISMLVSIWLCDTAAFYAGTALGRHKLFERVSPKKSWEGAIFGFIFAIVAFVIAKLFILSFLSWKDVFILGLIIGIVGQIGDLVESLFKRDAGIKDSSTLIPGHGGVLDRFDSLLFSSPVIWLYLKYFS